MTSLKLHHEALGPVLGQLFLPESGLYSFYVLFAHHVEIIGSHLFMFHIFSDTGCGNSWSKFGTCRDWMRQRYSCKT